jgi:signal transduction histidine kinase
VDDGYLRWPTLFRRQWPLAIALAGMQALEMVSWRGLAPSQWWQLPGELVVCALAVIAPRRPFDAVLAATCAIAASTVLLWVLGVRVLGADLIVMAASMALTAILVRMVSRGRAVLGTLLVIAAFLFSVILRHGYFADDYALGIENFTVWLLLFGIAVGTGMYFRARDSERRGTEAASVAVAQQAERLALARELHDVVAHYVTGIVVHSQAAQAIADKDPDAAMSVLPIITASGHEALTAMRRLVGTLRGTESSGASRDNNELTDQIRKLVGQAGGPVRLTVELTDPVPPELAQSVLRLVQESLTNSGKHAAGATRVDVEVRTTGEAVTVQVADDGVGQHANPAGGSGGYGLIGMRERVELLGGQFHAGPSGNRGWAVSAQLPLRMTESRHG